MEHARLRRRLITATVVFACAPLLASALASGASATSRASHRAHAHGFWAVATPGESFTKIAHAAAHAPRKQPVATTIEAMLKRLNAGHDVYVPEGTRNSVTSVKATPQELRAAVRAARLSRAGSTPKTVPKNFPFNGYGCDVDGPYYSHWCGKYVLDVDYCDPKGCELEDRITAKVTVDPGVKKSRVVYKSLYSPDHRDFTDIHFEWWTLCYGHADVCGHHDTENFKGSSSGTFYPESDVHLYGDRLAHAFELWAYSTQTGEFVGDPGRTGTALCEERPETACVY